MSRDDARTAGWLTVLAEREGLRWVLAKSKMAFSERVGLRAQKMRIGAPLVIYTARGAFHNPTRDQSQLLGLATIGSAVRRMRSPLTIGERRFVWACDLQLDLVLPERQGVPVAPLVPHLKVFRRKKVWGHYLRAGLLALGSHDVELIASVIRKHHARLGKARS